jgi:F0F1-type ATP synthase assembly protein I
MAQADLMSPGAIRVAAPKPRMTIYFALLIISLVALLAGCLFLWREISRFGGFGAVPGQVSSSIPSELFVGHRVHRVHREEGTELVSVNSVPSVANS